MALGTGFDEVQCLYARRNAASRYPPAPPVLVPSPHAMASLA
jgi:hypothetical protein